MFKEHDLSRAPYTDPANLGQFQEYLQANGENLAPPMEEVAVNRWMVFIRTALTTLKGEGVVYSGVGLNYTVEFPMGAAARNRLIFTSDSDRVQYLLADGKTSISMHGVTNVLQIGEDEISIQGGGDFSSTRLSIRPNGQSRLAIEPRYPNR